MATRGCKITPHCGKRAIGKPKSLYKDEGFGQLWEDKIVLKKCITLRRESDREFKFFQNRDACYALGGS